MLLTPFETNTVIAFDKQVYKKITILLPLYKENIGSYLSAILGQYGIRNQQFVSIVLRLFYNLLKGDNEFMDYYFLDVSFDTDDGDNDETIYSKSSNISSVGNSNISSSDNVVGQSLPDIEFDDKKPLSELNVIIPCFVLLKKTGAFCVYIKQFFGGHLFKFFIKQKIRRKRVPFYIRSDFRLLLKYGYYSTCFRKTIKYYFKRFRRRYYLNFLALYKIFIFKMFYLVEDRGVLYKQEYYKKLRLTFYNKWR